MRFRGGEGLKPKSSRNCVKFLATPLDSVPYNAAPRHGGRKVEGHVAVGEEPMKLAIRTSILMLGLVGTYVLAAVPKVPALDGGSIPLCPPHVTSSLATRCR